MKAFVISLKSADEGGNPKLRALLEKHDIAVEFIPAVNGRKMPAGDYFMATRGYFNSTGRMLTPAEVGCGMSHMKVYEKIVAEQLPYALVLEDDAILDDAAVAAIHELVASKLHERGFVHLGGQEGLEDSIADVRGRLLPGARQIWDLNPDDWCDVYRSVGYIMSGELGAKAAALAREHGVFLSDDFTFYLGRTGTEHMFLCNLVGHPLDLGGSAIEAERKAAREQRRSIKRGLLARLQTELKRTIAYRTGALQRARRAKMYERISLAKRPENGVA